MTTPPFLCGHSLATARRRGHRVVCGVCGSFWDMESHAARVSYDAAYPEQRGHFDPRVGVLKVRTLRHWLRAGGVDVRNRRVCEIGFGGGSCLAFLEQRARSVVGIEANETTLAHARNAGSRAELLLAQSLPARLGEPVGLWLFQDSFEHLPDPGAVLDWMRQNSTVDAEILLVAPRADSLSQRLLGRYWPHKLPDHEFHWSRRGLEQIMTSRGFTVRRAFFPLKFASPQMVVAHVLHKLGASDALRRWMGGVGFALPINFGEMGLVLARRD